MCIYIYMHSPMRRGLNYFHLLNDNCIKKRLLINEYLKISLSSLINDTKREENANIYIQEL